MRCRELGGIKLRWLLVQARTVLRPTQLTISVSSRAALARRQQAGTFCTLQQRDVAGVFTQARVRGGMGENQVLHAELNVHHGAGAVFHIEAPVGHRPRGTYPLAHHAHLVAQRGVHVRR